MARIAVIRGGRSLEREFSLRSGFHVATAMQHLGHDVVELDVDERLARSLADVDAAFIALHGRDGEDGTIQAICEAQGIAYTGSDPFTCQLCFDKTLAKGILYRRGIATPDGFDLSAEAVRGMGAGPAVRTGAERIGYPLVVKPAAQGSALGLGVVTDPNDLSAAVMTAFNYSDRVLIERYIQGVELAVTVTGNPLVALPAVRIKAPGGSMPVFDLDARMAPLSTDFICPADVDDAMREAALDTALRAGAALGVRDIARVDMIVGEDGPVVLEVNPCPGMTESSLLPLAVNASGSSFNDFVAAVTNAALARRVKSPK